MDLHVYVGPCMLYNGDLVLGSLQNSGNRISVSGAIEFYN